MYKWILSSIDNVLPYSLLSQIPQYIFDILDPPPHPPHPPPKKIAYAIFFRGGGEGKRVVL